MKKNLLTTLLLVQSIILFAPPKDKKRSSSSPEGQLAGAAAAVAIIRDSPTRELASTLRPPEEQGTYSGVTSQLPAPDNSPNELYLENTPLTDVSRSTRATSSALDASRSTTATSSALAGQRLVDAEEARRNFCIVDEDGTVTAVPDDTSPHNSAKAFLTRITSATSLGLSALRAVAGHCGLTSQASRFCSMSKEELELFIQSRGSSANPNEGYHEIEIAILESISQGDTETALLLFNKIFPKKSCLTSATLKQLSQATQIYQRDIDGEILEALIIYGQRTARTAHMKAEADKVDRSSLFKPQTGDRMAEFIQERLEDIRNFASTNLTSPRTI
jgi:hypothetical protein